MAKRKRPILGCAFDPDQRNERGIVEAYIRELEHYRPRGFAKLRNEGVTLLKKPDEHADWNWSSEWQNDCDQLLGEHAERCGMPYVSFGPFEHGGAVGYYVDLESAKDDADLTVDDTGQVPKNFTGLVLQVSDHGNVMALRYSRGKSRELWAVV